MVTKWCPAINSSSSSSTSSYSLYIVLNHSVDLFGRIVIGHDDDDDDDGYTVEVRTMERET